MRVLKKEIQHYPWYLKPFFRLQKRKYGQVLDPALIWARQPGLFAGVAFLYGVLERKKSPLNPVLRALVTVRVSQINACHFCVDINSSILEKRSCPIEKIENLPFWRDSEHYDEIERTVLEYAESITYTDRQVSDEAVDRLRNFFNEEAIVELTGLIAFQNLSSKFNSALDIPPQGFCALPLFSDKVENQPEKMPPSGGGGGEAKAGPD